MASRAKPAIKNTPPDEGEARLRLLTAAADLFTQRGFDATSVREIAQHADVNIAMISYYFGSKEALYAQLFEEKLKYMRERLTELNAAKLSPEEKVRKLIVSYVERVLTHAAFHRVMIRELSMGERSSINKHIQAVLTKNMELVEHIFDEGVQRKVFRKVDTRLLMFSIIGTLNMCVTQMAFTSKLFRLKNETDVAGDVFKQRLIKHLTEMVLHHITI